MSGATGERFGVTSFENPVGGVGTAPSANHLQRGSLAGSTSSVFFKNHLVANVGVTNASGDVQDLYGETLDPADPQRYLDGGTSRPFEVVNEVIRIQGELGNTVMMITHDVDEAVLLSDRVVMMTNGPAATIGQILDVPLPRPRNRIELAENKDYNHCRQEILTFLYEKQRKIEPIAQARQTAAAPARARAELKA